jgi:hypothetical protein
MRTVCEADSNLSWVVSLHAIAGAWRDTWQSGIDGRLSTRYYLYGCRDILATDKGRTPS